MTQHVQSIYLENRVLPLVTLTSHYLENKLVGALAQEERQPRYYTFSTPGRDNCFVGDMVLLRPGNQCAVSPLVPTSYLMCPVKLTAVVLEYCHVNPLVYMVVKICSYFVIFTMAYNYE